MNSELTIQLINEDIDVKFYKNYKNMKLLNMFK